MHGDTGFLHGPAARAWLEEIGRQDAPAWAKAPDFPPGPPDPMSREETREALEGLIAGLEDAAKALRSWATDPQARRLLDGPGPLLKVYRERQDLAGPADEAAREAFTFAGRQANLILAKAPDPEA